MTAEAEESWRCFHCGEVLTTRHDAEDHFGLDMSDLPVCVMAATEEWKAVLEDRRLWKRRAQSAEDEVENLEHRVSAESWELRQFGKDVRTVNQAYNVYDSEKGRRLSAEAKVRELTQRLKDAGVPWQPLEYEDRTEEEILRESR